MSNPTHLILRPLKRIWCAGQIDRRPRSEIVHQTGHLGFDEFLELERRDSHFVDEERAAQGRPFR